MRVRIGQGYRLIGKALDVKSGNAGSSPAGPPSNLTLLEYFAQGTSLGFLAPVAKQVDARGLEPRVRMGVGVRIPPGAFPLERRCL